MMPRSTVPATTRVIFTPRDTAVEYSARLRPNRAGFWIGSCARSRVSERCVHDLHEIPGCVRLFPTFRNHCNFPHAGHHGGA